MPLAGFSARDWWLIAAITFVAQLLGHTLLNLVLSSVGPTVVSLAVLLEVPGSLIVALVLLDQAPPLLALPGMAAVVVGVALVVRASRPDDRWSSRRRACEHRAAIVTVRSGGTARERIGVATLR